MGTLLFKLARSKFASFLIGFAFAHMSFAIPVQRLRETQTLIAFYHHKPSYAVHILLVPKQAVTSLMALAPDDATFLTDLLSTVQSLVRELNLEPAGYRLIANGGEYQNVPQLHFHLVSGKANTPDL